MINIDAKNILKEEFKCFATIAKKIQANIQLKVNFNGNQKHLMLCEDCYRKEREKLGASFGSPMSGLSGFGGSPINDMFNHFSGNINNQTPNNPGAISN